MQFELKLALVAGTVLSAILFYGPGILSFEESKSRADKDKASLSTAQLSQLEDKQERFAAQAIPACQKLAGATLDTFTLVVEVGANGQVARSWRQGDSKFAICFQRITTDYFEFRAFEQTFFTSYEFNDAS